MLDGDHFSNLTVFKIVELFRSCVGFVCIVGRLVSTVRQLMHILVDSVSLFGVTHPESGASKDDACWAGPDLWKAWREHPNSPDLILHIELGVPSSPARNAEC